MSYQSRSLYKIIEAINNRSLFLPHIQRPFVWSKEQMQRLFDSLMRSYPIQTMLFWRTKDEIKARRFMPELKWEADLHLLYDNDASKPGIEKTFVLDGQQRIQTLYTLFSGGVYVDDKLPIEEAYVDVTSGTSVDARGLLYHLEFSATPKPLPFYRLRDLRERDDRKAAFDISSALNDALDTQLIAESPEARRKRQSQVHRNLSQIHTLLRNDGYFWVEELDGVANDYPYTKILEIFVRVNSGGTKLDAADLMFAAIKSVWEPIEKNIEEAVTALNNDRLAFEKDFALKCLVTAHGRGATLTPDKFNSQAGDALLADIKTHWQRAEDTFDQLRDFIVNDLKIYSTKVIRSHNSFVPLFDYLYNNPKPDPVSRAWMVAYYYKSQLFNWYSSGTDGTIDALHGIVGKPLKEFPLVAIKSYFAPSSDVEVKRSHLEDMRLRYIFLNMVYVSRFGTSPFNVSSENNEPQIDHIYPQSMLRSKLSFATSDINHLGNYRFIGASDNLRKRAELPASYFARLMQSGVDISHHLLVDRFAQDPSKLVFDRPTYLTFRNERLDKIFDIAKKIVNPELP
ncbi:GmrSD restriction endonuclease domain-containing protein [Archangium violaceum]|uniref:GmrSD restriction endonucleases N-terminal domain-containing protein n=1 Tax=Archangium violaceum Cb vi76 TaxID=1406225 RepID=A0A084SP66_9BACT|nr:DUF262 domain-containing protein [Archangium violaceum]KFA90251.1 hypothetical protein Q664_30280 [Archangium violaceum Cb vi76]